jgi:hypothetical protein
MSRLLLRLQHDDRGQTLLTQTLLLVPLLILMIGLVYDLGGLAIAQARAQDAADLAVQDAAKYLHVGSFYAGQEVRISQASVEVASRQAQAYSGGDLALRRLYLVRPDSRHTGLVLEGETTIPMRFLWLIGIPEAERRVQAMAVLSFGIEAEGE